MRHEDRRAARTSVVRLRVVATTVGDLKRWLKIGFEAVAKRLHRATRHEERHGKLTSTNPLRERTDADWLEMHRLKASRRERQDENDRPGGKT